MMQSLTKREKALLCILAGVVFVYLSFTFLIAPALRAKSKSARVYEEVSGRHQQAVQKIEGINDLSRAYEQARDTANAQKAQFPAENNAAQIDEMIGALCKQAGLEIQSMQLGIPQGLEAEKITAVQTGDTATEQPQKQGTAATPPQILNISVTLLCRGDKDAVRSFMAVIERRGDMCVQSLKYDESKSATLVIDVYVRQNMTVE